MFARKASGLPKDPVFPSDLKGLGYFLNDEDEIRNIQRPKEYFKYFLTRNERYNDVQKERMNEITRNMAQERIEALKYERVPLPIGVKETSPHIPIYVSANIRTAKHVIVLFYEKEQDLGVLAIRIMGGRGGINQGSVVNMLKYIETMRFPKDPCNPSGLCDDEAPGVILANMGQLLWNRKFKKAMTYTSWHALPRKYAVDPDYRIDPYNNSVEGNRTTSEHCAYILEKFVPHFCTPKAKLNVIGVSQGAAEFMIYLDSHWDAMKGRLEKIALLAPYFYEREYETEALKEWLRENGRAYIQSEKPLGTLVQFYDGQLASKEDALKAAESQLEWEADDGVKIVDMATTCEGYGCPTFSLGEQNYSECMLPKGYKFVLDGFGGKAGDGDVKPDISVGAAEEARKSAEEAKTSVVVEEKKDDGAGAGEKSAGEETGKEKTDEETGKEKAAEEAGKEKADSETGKEKTDDKGADGPEEPKEAGPSGGIAETVIETVKAGLSKLSLTGKED